MKTTINLILSLVCRKKPAVWLYDEHGRFIKSI